MIIDMHNHTNLYSVCSIISPDELIDRYIKYKIDGICITEHNIAWDIRKQEELINKFKGKINIFFGAEINTDFGHVLIFSKKYNQYEDCIELKKIFKFIDDNTAIIWAHPLRWINEDKIKLTNNLVNSFDAIELLNGNLSEETIKLTYNKFLEYNPKFTGGSDTHSLSMACKYATKFKNDRIGSLDDLIFNIKNGNYNPIRL